MHVELVARIYAAIPDKRPAEAERLPHRVLTEGRGGCVAHTVAFISVAQESRIVARRALGLVVAEGRLWAHEWAQVEVKGTWFDVDPTEGMAPAQAPRILFAAGDAADEQAAARVAEVVRVAKIRRIVQ